MISPELLRRYPFFAHLNEAQLRALAMIADEFSFPAGTVIISERDPADWLFLLIAGGIDLTYKSEEEYHPTSSKIFHVGEINPGEVFGISSLIEPYRYNATATASVDSKTIRIDAAALRTLLDLDNSMGCAIIRQIAKTVMERLTYTRIQLAAAQS